MQTEVFMAPGKTYDVMINAPSSATAVPPALPIFDREGSLSGNGRERDAGMLAYIGINGAAAPNVPSAAPVARPDLYTSLYANQPLAISDPTKGLTANDSNVYSVGVSTPPAQNRLGS